MRRERSQVPCRVSVTSRAAERPAGRLAGRMAAGPARGGRSAGPPTRNGTRARLARRQRLQQARDIRLLAGLRARTANGGRPAGGLGSETTERVSRLRPRGVRSGDAGRLECGEDRTIFGRLTVNIHERGYAGKQAAIAAELDPYHMYVYTSRRDQSHGGTGRSTHGRTGTVALKTQ